MKKFNTQDNLKLRRRMQALGVPLELHTDEKEIEVPPEERLIIEQSGICRAIETDLGGTAYILDVSIISSLVWPVELVSFTLELPWQNDSFQWLEDPAEADDDRGMYLIPGSKIHYPRHAVINHRVGPGRAIVRGRTISGLLLGIGSTLPDDVSQGSENPGLLEFSDQFGRKFSDLVTLIVDRTPSHHLTTRRQQLFVDRDQ